MHILFVSRGYPTKQEPTWGCFEKDQAESLAHLGHKVTVISVDIRFRWHWRKLGITQQHINGVSVYNLFCIPYALLFFLPTHWKHRFYAFLYKKLCKRVIQAEGQPDVIYAHYLNYMYYGIQLQKELDVPLVGIEHWSEMGKKDIQARSADLLPVGPTHCSILCIKRQHTQPHPNQYSNSGCKQYGGSRV